MSALLLYVSFGLLAACTISTEFAGVLCAAVLAAFAFLFKLPAVKTYHAYYGLAWGEHLGSSAAYANLSYCVN